MATVKILCALITVTLLFGEIRANEEPKTSSPTKYVPISSVLPSSLLFLLNRHRPSPPNTPVPSSLQSSPKELLRYPGTPQYFSVPVNSVPATPGQLSYDNASGNRRLLNKVQIPPRGIPAQPQPVGALPLNYNGSDTAPIFQQQPLPSNPNIVPLGALPLNGQTNRRSTITFNPEDLEPVPIDTIGASPIPVKSNGSSKSDDAKNTLTFNPKDIPYTPVQNIEASPIPIRPEVNRNPLETEDLSPLPSDAEDSIPNQPESNNENTITINPKDLTPEPIDTIAASPIPVRSKINRLPPLESLDSTEPKSAAAKNSQEKNTEGSSGEPQNPLNDLILNGASSNGNNGDSFNPLGNVLLNGTSEENDNPSNPLGNVLLNGTSSQGNQNGVTPNEPENPLRNLILNGGSSANNNDNSFNPLGNVLLNGTSEEEDNPSNPLGNVILNGTSSQGNQNGESPNEPQNPLRDLILNGASSNGNNGNSFNPLGNVLLNGTSEENNNPSNPLGNVILNGTSSQGNQNGESPSEPQNPLRDLILNGASSSNPLGNVLLNGTTSQGNQNGESPNEPQNPLRDLILNGSNHVQKSESESTESETESSGPNQENSYNEKEIQC